MFKEDTEKEESEKKNAAFIGWQLYTVVKSTGLIGGPFIKYPEYLDNLGLLTVKEKAGLELYRAILKEQNKEQAQRNIEEANSIIAMLKQQREGGANIGK